MTCINRLGAWLLVVGIVIIHLQLAEQYSSGDATECLFLESESTDFAELGARAFFLLRVVHIACIAYGGELCHHGLDSEHW